MQMSIGAHIEPNDCLLIIHSLLHLNEFFTQKTIVLINTPLRGEVNLAHE